MANMIFRRGTHSEVNNMPVQDGQLLFDTTNREILMDNGSQRQRYGGNVTIDDELSDTSENPVQNKVVKGALDNKLEASDVIDDLSTAVAVTENGVPVGCKAVAELNENLNVIQGDIDAIVPTFYNEVSVSSVFPFTAPHTGVICVTIYPQSDANIYLNLALYDANNTVVLGEALDIWGGNGGAQNTASCVVPKGYTLKIIRGPSNIEHIYASFTPLKND